MQPIPKDLGIDAHVWIQNRRGWENKEWDTHTHTPYQYQNATIIWIVSASKNSTVKIRPKGHKGEGNELIGRHMRSQGNGSQETRQQRANLPEPPLAAWMFPNDPGFVHGKTHMGKWISHKKTAKKHTMYIYIYIHVYIYIYTCDWARFMSAVMSTQFQLASGRTAATLMTKSHWQVVGGRGHSMQQETADRVAGL